jgi:hypothetical protein
MNMSREILRRVFAGYLLAIENFAEFLLVPCEPLKAVALDGQ